MSGKGHSTAVGHKELSTIDTREWAEEAVFALYVTREAEGIVQNVLCRQNCGVFTLDLPGAPPLHFKQNRDLQSLPGVTGAAVWDGSLVLGAYLYKHRKRLGLTHEKTVLELGSGCGPLGVYLHRGLGIERVLLTDMETMMPLLRQNIRSNDCVPSVNCLELTWGEDNDTVEIDRFFARAREETAQHQEHAQELVIDTPDFIVAADCVYAESLVPPFVETLRRFAGPKTVLFLAVTLRDSSVMEAFLSGMARYFTLELIDRSDCDANFNPVAVALYRGIRRETEVCEG